MQIFLASYNGISASPSNKSYKISFVVDETQREGILKTASNLNFGSEVLLMLFDTENDKKELVDVSTESPEETKKRFNRMLHARIREVAIKKGVSEEEIKAKLKSHLIEKKFIKSSSAELDVSGLAFAIQYVSKII